MEKIAEMYAGTPPFVSLLVPTEHVDEDSLDRLAVRWKKARHGLGELGASEQALGAIDDVVAGFARPGATLAIVADAERVLLAEALDDPDVAELVDVARFPRLAWWFELEQRRIPHVVVLADRVHADVLVRTASGEGSREIDSTASHIRKVQAGGWSQRRFQERAENSWEEQARDVATAVIRAADRVKARLILLAGEVRALQLLREHLPDRLRVEQLDAGLPPAGQTSEHLDEAIARAVATVVAEDTVAVLQAFEEERGQQDRAADGAEATLDALSRAQVATLLVHDDPADDRTGWASEAPVPVSVHGEVLAAIGVEPVFAARLVDLALRAAAGTGASVRIVPRAERGPDDGIGALLRWA